MRFDKPKNQRILYNFYGVEVDGHMYYPSHNVWMPYGEHPEGDWGYACSEKTCKSFRAFKRFVRQHPQFKGKIHLVSRLVGPDIHA